MCSVEEGEGVRKSLKFDVNEQSETYLGNTTSQDSDGVIPLATSVGVLSMDVRVVGD